jgi:GNAT superfamily N-acetyltransferase
MDGLKVQDAPFDGPLAQVLIAELQQEYVVRYGGEDDTPITSDEFAAPLGAFLIAMIDDVVAGCAGLRRNDDETAELKRMYVRASHRRQGVAQALLIAIEDRARSIGYRQLVLETGTKQPEAIGLYVTNGYSPITGFGYFKDFENSRAFVKVL